MSPKKKNPYATSTSRSSRTPQAGLEPAPAATAEPAPVAAPSGPSVVVVPTAAAAEPDAGQPGEASVEATQTEIDLATLQSVMGEAADGLISGLVEVHQQTGVGLRCLAALVGVPPDATVAAQNLQVLIDAGLSTASGLTARGQVLRTKVLKKIGLTGDQV